MGLLDYISRKPNQPAKSKSKYDEDFWIGTLSNIPSDNKKLQKKPSPLSLKIILDSTVTTANSTQ